MNVSENLLYEDVLISSKSFLKPKKVAVRADEAILR